MITLQAAYKTHTNLRQAWQSQQVTASRLASGLRIQKAADDAASLAVSVKLHSQIRSNEQARRNVEDGISLVQTAGTALQTVQNIMHRVRELYIQAQNGTLSANDKQIIQYEIDKLLSSVDDLTSGTKFNGRPLLSAWIEGTPGTPTIPSTPGTPPYEEIVPQTPIRYQAVSYAIDHNTPSSQLGSFLIPGGKLSGSLTIELSVLASDPLDKGLKYPEIRIIAPNSQVVYSKKEAAGNLTFSFTEPLSGNWSVEIKNPGRDSFYGTLSATYSYSEKVLNPGTPGTPEIPGTPGTPGRMGTLTLQIGAATGDRMQIELSDISTESLGIAGLVLNDSQGLAKIGQAADLISREIGRYGVYETILQDRHRLLGDLNFNYANAVSRIEDADMAAEIIKKVRSQLIQEAGMQALTKNLGFVRDHIAVLLTPPSPDMKFSNPESSMTSSAH